ncbi:alpha/beta fold hydrolase [Pontibacter sp. HJ8]
MVEIIENNDTRLFTTIQQNAGKETVILLHGGPGVPDGLGPVAAFLAPDYQVISFHQRGTRKSPTATHDYSLESYIADIDSIALQFSLDKFHLFGHSWGGLYAQIYAQHNSPRLLSMFLCSPCSGTGSHWRQTMVEIGKFHMAKTSLLEKSDMLLDSMMGLAGSDSAYRRLFRQFSLNFNKGFQVTDRVPFEISCIMARAINGTTGILLLAPELRQMPDPGYGITITYGYQDIYGSSVKYITQRYPTAKIITIPSSGHLPWLHNEKAFYKLLAEHYGMNSAKASETVTEK